MRPPKCPHHSRIIKLCLLQLVAVASAVKFDPCSEITPITRVSCCWATKPCKQCCTWHDLIAQMVGCCSQQGSPIVLGLAYWPGGLISDWGDPTTGLNPCNSTVQANLVSKAGERTALPRVLCDGCCLQAQ